MALYKYYVLGYVSDMPLPVFFLRQKAPSLVVRRAVQRGKEWGGMESFRSTGRILHPYYSGILLLGYTINYHTIWIAALWTRAQLLLTSFRL